MFTSTFYSYKGGVGRTTALANVAAELSRRGKTVLIADFDLEAPGVSTIPFAENGIEKKQSPGIVDFIHRWLETNRSPDVEDFVMTYRPPGAGTIWVMPAGNRDGGYGPRLNKIDWADLYENRDGFLVLEDLKRQWKQKFNPDYVLIDSRTGHTDIGGICTRQLPDLVVFVFWPNIQNLAGLQLIAAEMDAQAQNSSRKIGRLFVPSNLPTIDDEEELLKEALTDFRTRLHYDVPDEIQIHNYQSIDFLKQLLFTTARPKTSIAQEYRNLAEAIMSQNLDDEDGVRLLLSKILDKTTSGNGKRSGSGTISSGVFSDVEKFALDPTDLMKDWKDPSLHGLVARYFEREQNTGLSIFELKRAIKRDPANLEFNFELAKLLIGSTDTVERADAPDVVRRIFSNEASKPTHLATALKLHASLPDQADNDLIDEAPAFLKLSELGWRQVLSPLRYKRNDARIAARILKQVYKRNGATWKDLTAINQLSLVVIAGGEFELAYKMLSTANMGINTQFNLTISKWGMLRKVPNTEFESVALTMDQHQQRHGQLNFEQCWALSLMALGRGDEAKRHIKRAKAALSDGAYEFSCWSYLESSPIEFNDDLMAMEKQLEIGELAPPVFSDAW